MEISGRAFAIWYYMEPGGLWWTNVLISALPPQSHRPDTRLEHQDPVSHTAWLTPCIVMISLCASQSDTGGLLNSCDHRMHLQSCFLVFAHGIFYGQSSFSSWGILSSDCLSIYILENPPSTVIGIISSRSSPYREGQGEDGANSSNCRERCSGSDLEVAGPAWRGHPTDPESESLI